jgi:hypothetical protein
MSNEERGGPAPRRYPPFYEKIVPIVLGILLAATVIVLVIVLVVALGLFPAR